MIGTTAKQVIRGNTGSRGACINQPPQSIFHQPVVKGGRHNGRRNSPGGPLLFITTTTYHLPFTIYHIPFISRLQSVSSVVLARIVFLGAAVRRVNAIKAIEAIYLHLYLHPHLHLAFGYRDRPNQKDTSLWRCWLIIRTHHISHISHFPHLPFPPSPSNYRCWFLLSQ